MNIFKRNKERKEEEKERTIRSYNSTFLQAVRLISKKGEYNVSDEQIKELQSLTVYKYVIEKKYEEMGPELRHFGGEIIDMFLPFFGIPELPKDERPFEEIVKEAYEKYQQEQLKKNKNKNQNNND